MSNKQNKNSVPLSLSSASVKRSISVLKQNKNAQIAEYSNSNTDPNRVKIYKINLNRPFPSSREFHPTKFSLPERFLPLPSKRKLIWL